MLAKFICHLTFLCSPLYVQQLNEIPAVLKKRDAHEFKESVGDRRAHTPCPAILTVSGSFAFKVSTSEAP